MLDIDISLVYQFIGYFVLLLILNRLLYRPVQKILRERDERIGGTLKKASDTEAEVASGLADYDKKLREAAVKGNEHRAKIKAEAAAKEKEILEAAGKEVSAELDKMRKELAASKSGALASLKDQTRELSRTVAEKLLDRKVIAMLLTVGLPLLPSLVLAATTGGGGEHGGGGGGEEHGAALFDPWKVINFLILAAVIFVVWKKVLGKLLDKRKDDIRQAIEEAGAAKEAAEKKAAEYEKKLATLEARIKEIAEELRLEGEAEKERTLVEAARAGEKLKEQAKLTAEQELKKARIAIRKEVAELAVGMAAELLAKEVTPDDQKRLVKGYIDNLKLN
jgi:F-type H+-transporting ATPase subunit b